MSNMPARSNTGSPSTANILNGLAPGPQNDFRHRASFCGVNGNDFGKRLRALLDDRSGDYQGFAADLGVNLLYVESLMNEPFTVSNPSARLLSGWARY